MCITYLDALECFRGLRMLLTENVPHVDGRSGFQPAFTLPGFPPNQHQQQKGGKWCGSVWTYFSPLVRRNSLFGFPFAFFFLL